MKIHGSIEIPNSELCKEGVTPKEIEEFLSAFRESVLDEAPAGTIVSLVLEDAPDGILRTLAVEAPKDRPPANELGDALKRAAPEGGEGK